MYYATKQKSFQNWVKRKHAMKTRSSKKKQIQTKKPNNEKFKKSVTYIGSRLWNTLPAETQKQSDYQLFKAMLKRHLNTLKNKTQTQNQEI